MAAAKFITMEGGEGAGKSTQARLLAERLRTRGIETLVTREPGGSPFAEQLRAILLDPKTADHGALGETLLFYAARADHLAKTIRPALNLGKWVICDRFSDSTTVYQGVAGGVATETLAALEDIVVASTRPDLTVILDLPAEAGLERANLRHEQLPLGRAKAGEPARLDERDAYEARSLTFHEKLRDGFLALAAAEPERCIVIDGSQRVDAVARDIWAAVSDRLLQSAG